MATTKPPTNPFTYERPWLADYQLDALFCAERYGVVEATTKAGKTVGCMVWLTEQAIKGKPGRNYWWVAPILAQAKIAFRRLKQGLPPDVYTANLGELTLTLANGAVLWFKGADHPDSLYGEDVYAAVIDEASRCKEDAWFAVRSTLTATRGPLRIIGNVKGRRNWAYQLARKAEAGEPGMHYAKITAYDAVQAGILTGAEVEDARRQLPEQVFRELYEAIPSDDGGNPFGLAAITACLGPLSDGAPVAWGWDLARSVDWTWGIALDRQGRVCRSERWQGDWDQTIAKIDRITGGVQALIDDTGVGDAITPLLQKGLNSREGYKFSQPSKQQLMEGLAVAIQRQEVTFPDGPLRAELEAFEYEYTRTGVRYSAPDGMHDDGVMALGLAVRCLATHPAFNVATAYHMLACPKCGSPTVVPPWLGFARCAQCGERVEAMPDAEPEPTVVRPMFAEPADDPDEENPWLSVYAKPSGPSAARSSRPGAS